MLHRRPPLSVHSCSVLGNKLRDGQSVRWVMPLHGRSKVSCDISVRLILRIALSRADAHATLHFPGPEVEKRINEYRKQNGTVLFGGKLLSDVDHTHALPDNMGATLPPIQAP